MPASEWGGGWSEMEKVTSAFGFSTWMAVTEMTDAKVLLNSSNTSNNGSSYWHCPLKATCSSQTGPLSALSNLLVEGGQALLEMRTRVTGAQRLLRSCNYPFVMLDSASVHAPCAEPPGKCLQN